MSTRDTTTARIKPAAYRPRRPVWALQVTTANMAEIASWCEGGVVGGALVLVPRRGGPPMVAVVEDWVVKRGHRWFVVLDDITFCRDYAALDAPPAYDAQAAAEYTITAEQAQSAADQLLEKFGHRPTKQYKDQQLVTIKPTAPGPERNPEQVANWETPEFETEYEESVDGRGLPPNVAPITPEPAPIMQPANPTAAWSRGWSGRLAGRKRDDCPYNPDLDWAIPKGAYADWTAGWDAADASMKGGS